MVTCLRSNAEQEQSRGNLRRKETMQRTFKQKTSNRTPVESQRECKTSKGSQQVTALRRKNIQKEVHKHLKRGHSGDKQNKRNSGRKNESLKKRKQRKR